jgi:hypothetical protein
LADALVPKLTIVASSPSPYPNSAFPVFQVASLNVLDLQAVLWLDPLSRYFQEDFNGTIVTCASTSRCTSEINKTAKRKKLFFLATITSVFKTIQLANLISKDIGECNSGDNKMQAN